MNSDPWIIREMNFAVGDDEGVTYAVTRQNTPIPLLMIGDIMPIADCYNREDAERVREALELRDALSKAAEALKPFALVAGQDISPDEADIDRFVPMTEKNRRGPRISVGHMRRAREAFDALSKAEGLSDALEDGQ